MAVGVTVVTTTALLHVEYDCTVLRGVGRRRRAGLLATSCTLFNLATPGLDNRLPNKIEYVRGSGGGHPLPTQAIVVAVVTRSSCCLGLRRPFGVRRGSRRRHIAHRNKLANVTITKAHLNTLLCYVCVSFFLCRTPPLPFTPAPMSVVPWVSTLPSVPSLSLSLRVSLRSAPRTMDHATFTTSENQKTCVQGVHGNCRECSAGY